MKLIQIFVLVAALAANTTAQANGQSTGPAAPSTAKPQPQHQAATTTNPKKKDSAKNSAASKNKNTAGSSGQTGGIKVIVPPKSASQTTPSSTKNTGVKPETPAAGSKVPAGTKLAAQPAASKSSAPTTGSSP